MNWPDDFINKVICGDCRDILPLIPDGVVNAVITDPPYGIDLDTANKKRQRGNWSVGRDYPKVYGDNKPFNPKHLLRFYNKPIFLSGGNYYASGLPDCRGYVIWDKTGGGQHICDNADAELIWNNVLNVSRIFHHLWHGAMKGSERQDPRQHPTQKPIALMRWIISKWTKPNDLILDCYAGSGSTLVAAKQLGRRYIGIEISPEYCRISEDRLRQGELFYDTA